MTFTQEYERMRPLDLDEHENAVVFTVAKEPPFNVQKWFLEYFLSLKAKLIVPEIDAEIDEELAELDEDDEIDWDEVKADQPKWYKDGILLSPEEQHWWCVPYTNCSCGARATYLVRNQWVCINHVNL